MGVRGAGAAPESPGRQRSRGCFVLPRGGSWSLALVASPIQETRLSRVMSFDRIAPHYGWLERVLAGGKLQTMRTRWMEDFPEPRRALLAGEGHGRFLVPLLRTFPSVRIVFVDASSAMHTVARHRMKQAGFPETRVQFIQAQLPHSDLATGDFDLVVTHFFLDCFPPDQLNAVIGNLAGASTAQANWLLADFCIPTSGLSRVRARWIIAIMYLFFRAATRLPARTLTSPDRLLNAQGFRLKRRCLAEWGLIHSDRWEREMVPKNPTSCTP